MGVMNDEQRDEQLKRLAEHYHRPPQTVPRDEMWAAIVAERSAHRPEVQAIHARRPWWPMALAASLLLAAGIGIGRQWVTRETPQPVAAVTDTPRTARPGDPSVSYQVAALRHFSQAEALLTQARSDVNQKNDAQLASWARDLLSNTRLLLDSPAGRDPARRQLLQDLELALVQIVQLAPDTSKAARRDDGFINDQLLTKLRTAIPAGQRGT
jgi:hypothetical protein